MQNTELKDFIVDIFQDICETESLLKVMLETTSSQKNIVTMTDFENVLEITVAKISNIKISLDKYINIAFERK